MGRPSILKELARLLRSWWRVDRIRVARDDGRLLRLGPGAIIEVDGRPFVIKRRVVGERSGLVYECEGVAETSTLEVLVGVQENSSSMTWVRGIGADGLRRRKLAPEQVEIIAGG